MIDIIEGGKRQKAKILVVGVGGGGRNAVTRMIDDHVSNIYFIRIDTQEMNPDDKSEDTIQIGRNVTNGLGAGANPEIGRAAAEEDVEKISAAFKDADMVIVTCGMGGGTGTGASPVVARIAKEQGKLTVGAVTLPFGFEARVRMSNARDGIEQLRQYVDTLIVVPNDNLLGLVDKRATFSDALKVADGVLRQLVQSITDIGNVTADINIDFADLKTVMRDKGVAHVGIGTSSGNEKAKTAIESAVNSPLLETNVAHATDIIMRITGEVSLGDVTDAMQYIYSMTGADVNIIFGFRYDETMEDTCSIILIATGIKGNGI